MTSKPLTERAPLHPPPCQPSLSRLTNGGKKKKKQKPKNKPQTKEFSQMKKFTFIRFIEPAEREEIGIGHYGEGEAEAEDGDSKEGARKPLSQANG